MGFQMESEYDAGEQGFISSAQSSVNNEQLNNYNVTHSFFGRKELSSAVSQQMCW